jgi:hypothetical protein
VQPGSGPPGGDGEVEVGEQSGLGLADIGNRIDAVQCSGDNPRVPYEAGLHSLGVQLLEGGQSVRIARDLDLEALTSFPETPGRFETLLTHEPIDGRGYNRLAVDRGLPFEPLRRHRPRLDGTNR